MDRKALNQRCITLMQHPRVKVQMWHPRLFWYVRRNNPDPAQLKRPKVDLEELEVMLSAAARESSRIAAALDARNPGRADCIVRAVRGGQRPLLAPA